MCAATVIVYMEEEKADKGDLALGMAHATRGYYFVVLSDPLSHLSCPISLFQEQDVDFSMVQVQHMKKTCS